MTVRDHRDVLAEQVALDGADVLDVGCGTGALVRWMRGRGARPVGVECGATMRAEAIAADPAHAADYLDAVGESLPLPDGSFDAVIYSYSLHHVPRSAMDDALREARRVLRPGGCLYVLEPAGRDADTYAACPAVDESAELADAQRVLDRGAEFGLTERASCEYSSESVYESVEAWLDLLIGVDSSRAAAVREHERELRERFDSFGRPGPGGVALRSSNRVRVFDT